MTTTAASESFPMVIRADHVLGPPQGCWTYEDYAALPDDGCRYEIINGVLYQMPSPNADHQNAAGLLTTYLTLHVFLGGRGRVFPAPFDVRLPSRREPVQPDVTVVLKANLSIIKEKYIEGTPDLVVEIASPGTVGYDRRAKQDAYAAAGVPEYWIADPYARTVEVLTLVEGSYRSLGVFEGGQTLSSKVLPNFLTPVAQLFVVAVEGTPDNH